MSMFVLVSGFWLGGAAWRDVVAELRAHDHGAYPVTLTGLGERQHLASAAVDLDTHIADIVNLIEYEDLTDVTLVGHSGGGPVTGAADRIPERIARVVFLDSGPTPDGLSYLDFMGPEVAAVVRERFTGGGYPMPAWEQHEQDGASLAGLGDAERTRFKALARPHPTGPLTQPLRLGGGFDKLPKALITCSFPLAQVKQMIAQQHPFFAGLAGPEWSLAELPTGHWPMFSSPADTAQTLISL